MKLVNLLKETFDVDLDEVSDTEFLIDGRDYLTALFGVS